MGDNTVEQKPTVLVTGNSLNLIEYAVINVDFFKDYFSSWEITPFELYYYTAYKEYEFVSLVLR